MTRPSDDPFFRVQVMAEKRALRNGHDPAEAGRQAIVLLRAMRLAEPEPSIESVLQAVAGRLTLSQG